MFNKVMVAIAAILAAVLFLAGCTPIEGPGPSQSTAADVVIFPAPSFIPGLPTRDAVQGELHTLIFDFDTLPSREFILLTFTALSPPPNPQAMVIPWASDEGEVGVGPRFAVFDMPARVALIFPDGVGSVSVSMQPTDVDGNVDPNSPNIVAACRIVEQGDAGLEVVDESEVVWPRRDFGDPNVPLAEINNCFWFNSAPSI